MSTEIVKRVLLEEANAIINLSEKVDGAFGNAVSMIESCTPSGCRNCGLRYRVESHLNCHRAQTVSASGGAWWVLVAVAVPAIRGYLGLQVHRRPI